ncbi:NAD-P-binding protein [Gloeopeniophorella convolvens]|nr:NAD-P-binding protein [Gloeopeniophorella convolvens]
MMKRSVYPFIDPQEHYNAQTFKDKVVLITGASRGIGLETAQTFARAGAHLVLVARKQETLDASRDSILKEVPSARVITFVADVRDTKKAEEAVSATVKEFGKLDILVPNAGTVRRYDEPFASKDPEGWWNVMEVNFRGPYNYIQYAIPFAIPELLKTKGRIVIVSSGAAQLRIALLSEYCMSKFAVNRFAEFVALEYPDIKIFALQPGAIDTAIHYEAQAPVMKNDTLALPAATILFLSAGKADYLSSRYVSANWDLEEVDRDWKEWIIRENGLVSKLSVPPAEQ